MYIIADDAPLGKAKSNNVEEKMAESRGKVLTSPAKCVTVRAVKLLKRRKYLRETVQRAAGWCKAAGEADGNGPPRAS